MKHHSATVAIAVLFLSATALAQQAEPAPQGAAAAPGDAQAADFQTSDAPSADAPTSPASTIQAPADDATTTDGGLAVIAVPSADAVAAVDMPAEDNQVAPIEEIVVTATKRPESARDIPASLTVLSGKDLEREGVQSLDQIVTQVPGVSLDDQGQGEAKRLTIRGISTDVNANFTAGTLFGDIPFSDPFIPKVQLDPNPFDMATVEVLKGPQGTLFGGTGLNGMIRYVPQAPQFDGFALKYFGQYDGYPGNGGGGWSYGAAINTPFADNAAAVRLVGYYRRAPGFVDDLRADRSDVNTARQYGFRAMLAWHPADEWTISLLAATQYAKQDDVAFTDNFDGKLSRNNSNRPSPTESRYDIANLGIEREFDWGNVVSQTAYVRKRFDAFLDASRAAADGALPILSAVDTNHSEGLTQELRVVSPSNDSPWKWLAGAFYSDLDLFDCAEAGLASDIPLISDLPIPVPLQSLIAVPCARNAGKLEGSLDVAKLVADVNIKEEALFGELTRELGDDWKAIVGARVYRTSSDGTVSRTGALYYTQGLGLDPVRDVGITEHGVSPKASIVFRPSDDINTYFTVSRGFRFGAPQAAASTLTTQVPDDYKSDSLWNYELGIRSDWFDRALRIDASLYYIDWKNPQVRQVSNDGLVQFIDNVGGAEGEGVDLSLRYRPKFLRGLSLSSSVAWNRTVTTADFDSAGGNTVESGSPWPLAPHWQTSTTLSYLLPFEAVASDVSLRQTYSSRACNDIDCGAKVFGYSTLDFIVSVAAVEHPAWPSLSLSLTNLTDKRGINAVSINPTLGDSISYIAPRAITVRLSGSF